VPWCLPPRVPTLQPDQPGFLQEHENWWELWEELAALKQRKQQQVRRRHPRGHCFAPEEPLVTTNNKVGPANLLKGGEDDRVVWVRGPMRRGPLDQIARRPAEIWCAGFDTGSA